MTAKTVEPGLIMVIDDEPRLVELLEQVFDELGHAVRSFTDPRQALAALEGLEPDVVITDVRMAPMDGIEVCTAVSQSHPDVPTIVLTAFGSMETAVGAMRAGAFDFLSKPIDLDKLEFAVERALAHRRLTVEVRRLREIVDPPPSDQILGDSPVMVELRRKLRKAARTDVPVLLSGETGTGKELAARALLWESSDEARPFIAVNCAALPAELLESELFGHTRGAFTGANAERSGLFVEAGDGVLFLDEIGEMPLALQPKLLRVLQERVLRPVGSDRVIPIRCRIVSATNRDLKAYSDAGHFRQDLYYRLAVIRLTLPPLRQRGGDILVLAHRFLQMAAEQMGREVSGMSRPVAQALLAYEWPGNVRELQNCVEQGVAMTEHDRLVIDDLPEELRAVQRQSAEDGDDTGFATLEAVELQHIVRVIDSVGGNKKMAAQILGVDRSTLYRKLDRVRKSS